MQPTVSVILPVYNVEKYIGKCIVSLLNQTLNNIQIIVVDDSSPDNSIKIINDIICKTQRADIEVKIIKHTTNKGLPAARNTGLKSVKGEYIYHCDSDDFLEINALEELYGAAKTNNADYVWCDWYLSFLENERYMKQPSLDTPQALIKSMLNGSMKYNVWNKLVKATIYSNHNIKFPEGYSMGEDMTMIKASLFATKVAYCPKALYHYVKINNSSITHMMNTQHFDAISHNVNDTIEFIRKYKDNEYDLEIEFFKLNAKFPFLISNNIELYDFWNTVYPESNKYIFQNKNQSFRAKILQWMASNKIYWFVKLHYLFIFNLFYKIFYK